MAELRCPSCGKELKERVEFCPHCKSHLTWDDAGGHTKDAPSDRQENESAGAVAVSVGASSLKLTPGQAANVKVTVENGADIVNELTVEIQGLEPQWVEASPASVALMPRSSDTIELTVRVPEDRAQGGRPLGVCDGRC